MTNYDVDKLVIDNPNDLQYISKYTNLTELEYSNIFARFGYDVQLTSLDNLPNSLKTLYCYSNKFIHVVNCLDNLPKSLTALNCFNNQIIHYVNGLDNLPNSLEFVIK